MDDYISREVAVKKITALINKSGKYTAYESGADDACYIVEHEIPAADVRIIRKDGRRMKYKTSCDDCLFKQTKEIFPGIEAEGCAMGGLMLKRVFSPSLCPLNLLLTEIEKAMEGGGEDG